MIKNRLTELTYFTTNLCNLRCKHCFVTEELNSKHEELLTISEIVKMGKYIPHMQRVHLGGGEPFMRDDISDLAVYLSNTWKTGVICIPTNGWFGENIIKTIEKFGEQGYGNLRLHFSINSPDPKDMDNFAQVTNTFKNWRKNIQLAKEVSKKYDNITLVALSTFNEFNQDSFIELIDFVMDEVGVDDFSFQLVRSHGDYNPILKEDEFTNAINYFFNEKSRDNTLLKAFRSLIRHKTVEYYKNPKYSIPCTAGTSRVVMSPSGEIYPCEKLGYPENKREAWHMGSIRDFDYNIVKLLESKKAQEIQNEILSSKCHCDHGIDSSLSLLSNTKFKVDVVTKAIENLIYKQTNQKINLSA